MKGWDKPYNCGMLHKSTYKQVSVDNRSKTSNGGYVTYFKLFRQLLSQMRASIHVLSTSQYVLMNVIAYTKFVWWCGIKPMGQFVSTLTHIKGTYTLTDGIFNNRDVKKNVLYIIFGITVYKTQLRLTEEDIREMLK